MMRVYRNQSESEISKTWKGWDEGKVDILDEKSDERWLLSGREKREGSLKEIHLHQDSRSSNLVILQELEKYGVKTEDILPHQKGMLRLKRITDLQTSSLSI